MIFQAVFVFDNFNYLLFFLSLLPVGIFLLFRKMFKKFNWNYGTKMILKIIGGIITIIFLFIVELGIFLSLPYTTNEPSVRQYKNSIKKLQHQYKKCDLTYFPEKIPQDATNYYFYIGTTFDGYNDYYLIFNTDKAYIENFIEKYKDDFSIIGTKNELNKKRLSIDINEIEDNDIIYLLKQRNPKDCENCKFGFAINENDNRVCFFFQNY